MTAAMMGTVFKPLATAIDAKLGRCYRCMQMSLASALGLWLLLAVAALAAAGTPTLLTLAVPAVAFTLWSAAHGVAYVLRGPERAKGCRNCAERARARQRAVRWRRRWAWLTGKPASAARQRRRKAGCRNCDRSVALKAEDTAAALPPAEQGLRHVAEDSPEFESLRPRLASQEPVDTWKTNMQSFFLYELKPDADGSVSHALFITRWEDDAPISAVVITPDPAGGEPRSVNLRSPQAGA